MQPVVIKARDGLELVSYLTLPPAATAKRAASRDRPVQPVPLVIDVHGGPWARDSWGLNPECQLWANRGYAVLNVNYRGSTGFGKKFSNAGEKEWGREDARRHSRRGRLGRARENRRSEKNRHHGRQLRRL